MPRTLRSSAKANVESKENVITTLVEEQKTPKAVRRKQKRIIPNSSSSSDDSSPPKSRRSNSLSPLAGSFANKLNVTTPKRTNMGSARCALTGNSDLSLPGREKEYEELMTYLMELIKSKGSGSMYISGTPGTGKTATLSKIVNSNELKSKLRIAFINCTSVTSIGAIYKKICRDLKLETETMREKDCLVAIEKYLKKSKKTTLLVLDEIDQLCATGKNQDVLYQIFEWPSIMNSKLILVGIANSLDLTDRMLDRLNTCELKPKAMHFAPYTKSQIVDIFKSRLEESGVSDLFPPVAIQLLAAKVSAVSGDIRRALNIGKRVIEMAELEKKRNAKTIDITKVEALIDDSTTTDTPKLEDKKIEMKNVMSVLSDVYGNTQKFSDDVDASFPAQQRILVCTLLLIIKHDKKKIITVGRLNDVYKRVCRNRNIESTDLAEFYNLCLLTETRGIIKILTKKEPRFHQVQLQWDENEVIAALKDKQMITSILNEKHLLTH